MPSTRRRGPSPSAWLAALFVIAAARSASAQRPDASDVLAVDGAGRSGGTVAVAQRAEPRTFNPTVAVDGPSREIIGRLNASLIRINRATLRTEAELARSWQASGDGRRYTLTLRRGIRFSDGEPFGADDVLFTFRVLLDEAVGSPQRDLLVVGGQPIQVRQIADDVVQFDLAQPYAAAERLFDGIAMLPRHRLEAAYQAGRLASAWGANVTPADVVGLGPFRLASRVAGERTVLERNPHYWKVDRQRTRLPYLDRLVFLSVPTEDAQTVRFLAGETHLISRISGEQFASLARAAPGGRHRVWDAGPGLEYAFLFFNQTEAPAAAPEAAARRAWFRDDRFRQAVSAAIDRDAIVRLAFQGKATPLWGHVTPGYGVWGNRAISKPPRSVDRARQLLRSAGFSTNSDGALVDAAQRPVTFTIVTNASNAQRVRMATIIQDDLKALGIRVQVVPLEFRALIDRVTRSFDYDACVLSLGGGDVDPNTEINVWLSSGANHLWRPSQPTPATAWEAEIDRLMRTQLVTLDVPMRKRLYDRVQVLVAEHLPLIPLASPNVLGGAATRLANVTPAILEPHTLWNIDELYWRP